MSESRAVPSSIDTDRLIFSARPLLHALIEKSGSATLTELALNNFSRLSSPSPKRKNEFISVCKKIAEQRLGTQVAAGLAQQLEKYFVFSTADHHGPLNSSLALSANLTIQAGLAALHDPIAQYIPVGSCAGISLSNEDFPRGILFHAHNQSASLERLSLLPNNSHSSMVYGFRPYSSAEVLKVKKVVAEKNRDGIILPAEQKDLSNILDTIYQTESVVDSRSLCEQYTKVNFFSWKNVPVLEPSIKKDLIYLEIEELAVQLLLDFHLDQPTVIQDLLCKSGDHVRLRTSLTTAMARFVRQGQIDTDLFWALSAKNQRKKLIRQGADLTTEDGEFRCELSPPSLADALNAKKIVPNLLLIYSVLHLYYGLNCLGGFNQMHYLAAMQEVYNSSGIDSEKSVGNSSLYNYGFNIVSLPPSNTAGVSGTITDLVLFDSPNWRQVIADTLKTKTVFEVFEENKHIIYSVLTE